MPRTRPAIGVDNRLAARIGADDTGGEVTGGFKLRQRLLVGGGFGQTPMQVQFVGTVLCVSAAASDDGGGADDCLEPGAGSFGIVVALGRERKRLSDIRLGGAASVLERRNRRREYDLVSGIGGVPGGVGGQRA